MYLCRLVLLLLNDFHLHYAVRLARAWCFLQHNASYKQQSSYWLMFDTFFKYTITANGKNDISWKKLHFLHRLAFLLLHINSRGITLPFGFVNSGVAICYLPAGLQVQVCENDNFLVVFLPAVIAKYAGHGRQASADVQQRGPSDPGGQFVQQGSKHIKCPTRKTRKATDICQSSSGKNVWQGLKMSDRVLKVCQTFCPARQK